MHNKTELLEERDRKPEGLQTLFIRPRNEKCVINVYENNKAVLVNKGKDGFNQFRKISRSVRGQTEDRVLIKLFIVILNISYAHRLQRWSDTRP